MTYVSFSFDVEDYVNKNAAGCVKELAEILRRNDVIGCFNITGWFINALREWGREDVIEAVKGHEIESHSLKHSYHPTINEYTDIEDAEEAIALFLKEESENLAILKEAFGISKVHAWCPPGNSTSYAGHYGVERLGIPVYDGDELTDHVRFRPINFCNLVCTRYSNDLIETLLKLNDDDIPSLLDELANAEYVTYANHPANFALTRFCDGLNFKGKNTPKENWIMSPTRDPEETAELFRKFEMLVKAIKADSRFKIITYEECYKIYGGKGRVITKDMLPNLKNQLEEFFFPVTTPDSFCIADVLLACRDFMLGQEKHHCEKVYGFLDTPYAIDKEITLTAAQIRSAAYQIGNYFLPTKLYIDNVEIGVCDWLFAALEVLLGAETVTLKPRNWQIETSQFNRYHAMHDNMNYKCWMQGPDFRDDYLSKRYLLQSYTIHLPKGTSRKIRV